MPNMYSTFLLVAAVSVGFWAPGSAQTIAASTLTFNCNDMPNVCENMCWGINCAGNAQAFRTLNWDNPPKATLKARRKTAGCSPGGPNRCSVLAKPPFPAANHNCDEFPFASVSESSAGGQFSRCVPTPENNIFPCTSQGAVLRKFFLGAAGCSNKPPCTFTIGFTNFVQDPAQSYCAISGLPDVLSFCTNSLRGLAGAQPQQEFANGALAPNPTQARLGSGAAASTFSSYRYRLASGTILTTFAKLDIGAKTVEAQVNSNCTANAAFTKLAARRAGVAEDAADQDEIDEILSYSPFMDLVEDTVEEEVTELD